MALQQQTQEDTQTMASQPQTQEDAQTMASQPQAQEDVQMAAQPDSQAVGSAYGSERLNQNHRIENVNPTTYRIYQESPTNPPEPEKRKKREKKAGAGMTWPKTVAAAVIIGLVAGCAFKGIDLAVDRRNSNGQTAQEQKQTVDNVKKASTVSENAVTMLDVSDMAASVMPSIVSITTQSVETIQTWFKQYQQEVSGSGSGIIIQQHNDDLYILTNYHVIENAVNLTVGFSDDTMVEAAVKGYNADADLAIVVVDMKKMSTSTVDAIKLAPLGDSDLLEVGEPAIAIGNALGYGQSLTGGFISATERVLDDSSLALIQTDAAINPGNSGGALFNARGEVIGVNSSKLVDSKVEGMGFAIPINKAMELMQGIIDGTSGNVESGSSNKGGYPNPEYGYGGDSLEDFFENFFGGGDTPQPGDENGNDDEQTPYVQQSSNKAFLGIVGKGVTEDYSEYLNMPQGVYITQVTENSPALEAGLKAGDIIIEVDGRTISEMQELSSYIGEKNPGDSISITYQRKNDNGTYETKTTTAVLAENENIQ